METVKRIDSYEDNRFSKAALIQHGCFLIDDVPYEIEIISDSEGIVRGADNNLFAKLIDEFRLYAPHIYRFYNQSRELIKSLSQSVSLESIWLRSSPPSSL